MMGDVYQMKVLPYRDIKILDGEFPFQDHSERQLTIIDKGRDIWEICHVAVDFEGEEIDDYIFQIGFMHEGSIVTHKEVIIFESNCAREFKYWDAYNDALPLIRDHLELYCSSIGYIPFWGTKEFDTYKDLGKSVRILEGPHKGGWLQKGERREVVLSDSNEFIYGPKV
jgi:hypothetical protein